MSEQIVKQNISLNLHGTKIAIRVLPEEEEFYRRAEKLINAKANTYFQLLAGRRTDQEILFACMLDIAVAYEKEQARNDTEPFNDLLETLTSELEETLKK